MTDQSPDQTPATQAKKDPVFAVYRHRKNDPQGNRQRSTQAVQRMMSEAFQSHGATPLNDDPASDSHPASDTGAGNSKSTPVNRPNEEVRAERLEEIKARIHAKVKRLRRPEQGATPLFPEVPASEPPPASVTSAEASAPKPASPNADVLAQRREAIKARIREKMKRWRKAH